MKVRVSAYLTISNWTDGLSGIEFDKKFEEIEVPYTVDLTNIKQWIHLNYLRIVSGSIEELETKKRTEERVLKQKEELEKEKQELQQEVANQQHDAELTDTTPDAADAEKKPKGGRKPKKTE